MRKVVYSSLAAAVVLFAASIGLVRPVGAYQTIAGGASPVAGAFLTEINFEGLMSQSLSVFDRDGTITDSVTTALGSFDGNLRSPNYGAWKRIGNNQLDVTTLGFLHNPDGSLLGTLRSHWTSTLPPGVLETFSGVGTVQFYFPGMDPLDPAAGFPAGNFSFTASRIRP